jgi:flagellar hook-associated protein 3 FlgL
MLSRVTQGSMIGDLQRNVARLQRRLVEVQSVLTSQKRIQQASDDPVGAAQANRLRNDVATRGAFREGAALGQVMLGAQDGALDQAHAVMVRAAEIANQQAGDLASPESRRQAALEIEELERVLVGIGNTTVAGRHVFGGLATGAAPFTAYDDPGFDPTTAYVGPADPFSIQTDTDRTVRITTAGDQVFEDALVGLDALRVALEAGSPPVTEFGAVQDAAGVLRVERSEVGVRLAALNDRNAVLAVEVGDARAALGEIEDADLTESIVELLQVQNALQATLASGQTLLEISILDYVAP